MINVKNKSIQEVANIITELKNKGYTLKKISTLLKFD